MPTPDAGMSTHDGERGSVERGRKGGGMKPVNGWAMVETLGGASTLLLPAMRTRTECIDDWCRTREEWRSMRRNGWTCVRVTVKEGV